jgi:hypothetical protein
MESLGYLGKLGMGGVMMVVWGFIYKIWTTPSDRLKTILVVASGLGVGLLFLIYDGVTPSVSNVLDYCFYGIQQGVTTVGLFKLGQAVGVYGSGGERR